MSECSRLGSEPVGPGWLIPSTVEGTRRGAARGPLSALRSRVWRGCGRSGTIRPMADVTPEAGGSSRGLNSRALAADTADLRASLAALARLVTGSQGLHELLERVATFAATAIPGADGAGVTLLKVYGAAHRVEGLAASHPFVREIDEIHVTVKEGPCITAVLEGRTVRGGLARSRADVAAIRPSGRAPRRAQRVVTAARATARRSRQLGRSVSTPTARTHSASTPPTSASYSQPRLQLPSTMPSF